MDKEELHSLIEKEQPNICQIVVLKNGTKVYSDEWNGYQKSDCVHVMSATNKDVSKPREVISTSGMLPSSSNSIFSTQARLDVMVPLVIL